MRFQPERAEFFITQIEIKNFQKLGILCKTFEIERFRVVIFEISKFVFGIFQFKEFQTIHLTKLNQKEVSRARLNILKFESFK